MGSKAAKRLPFLAACQPTHSAVQWSMAENTHTQPSSTVSIRMPSVPHIRSGAGVVIVPVCGSETP